MSLIQASTTFNIQMAEVYEPEGVDLLILPKTTGSDALRELHYPGDVFPPIIYPDMPDKWDNFDTVPLTGWPLTPTEMTLAGNQSARWPGYDADRPVKEYWQGNDTVGRVEMDFLRRLAEFFFNPPAEDFITWWPRDRTAAGFQILIESLTLGGQDLLTFYYPHITWEQAPGELVFSFRIVGPAE